MRRRLGTLAIVAALLTGTRFHIQVSEDETIRRAPEEIVAPAC